MQIKIEYLKTHKSVLCITSQAKTHIVEESELHRKECRRIEELQTEPNKLKSKTL